MLPFVKILNNDFSVASQLDLNQISAAACVGYKSIIIHRPDFEVEPSKPTSDVVIPFARSLGLSIEYQPLSVNGFTKPDLVQFSMLLKTLPVPILAYCCSGARSAKIFLIFKEKYKNL